MTHPLTSVIVTTYNRAALLKRCLQSVLDQENSRIEVVVVDDGSRDDTQAVIADFRDRVVYIRKKHSGIAATRNVGCRAANGEYIAFVDDDGIMHPRRLEVLGAALRRFPETTCAFCQGTEIDAQGKDLGTIVWPNLPSMRHSQLITEPYERMLEAAITVTPVNSLFRRDTGESVGWFDEAFVHTCEDTDFFMRMCEVGPMVYVPQVLTYVTWDAGPSLSGDRLSAAFSKVQLFEKHIGLNKDRGKYQYVRLLRDREYHFVKEILIGPHDLRGYQERHNVHLIRVLARFGARRVLYALYLKYVKRFLDTRL